MPIPVMYGDGIADEATIVDALQLLFARQLVALRDPDQGPLVDVLSLSLGYYHETAGTFDDEGALVSALRGLASTGVAVVAAAGNGASDVEFYPAAFSQSSNFDVPLASVGAHNPGGHQPHVVPPGTPTVSVYSNTGKWVTTYRCGTAVVSTMPVTFNGSIRSVLFQPGSPNPTRGSIDLDDYSGGFGQWSGTSFAAPAFAGDIAKRMLGPNAADTEADDTKTTKAGPPPERVAERRVRSAAEAVALAVKEGS
jgi:serine protease